MTDLETKVRRIMREVKDEAFAAELIIDAVIRGVGSRGGRPRKTQTEVCEPVTSVSTSSPPLSPPFLPLNNPPLMPPLSPPSERIPSPAKPAVYSPDFLAFWALYPKKVGKGAAFEQWQKLRPPLAAVETALSWQVPLWDDPKFIVDPERWLKKRRWEDEQSARAPPGSPFQKPAQQSIYRDLTADE